MPYELAVDLSSLHVHSTRISLKKATGENYSQIAFGLDFKNIQLPIVI
jgi:hypothetical protein